MTAPADPTDLALAAAAGRFDDPAVRAWVQRSMARWIAGEGEPNDRDRMRKAFGLPGPVGLARLRRDYWLHEAARHVDGASAWGRAVALAGELDRYERRGVLRRDRDAGGPPDGCSRLRAALWHAHQAGADMPASAKQLARILDMGRHCDVQRVAPTLEPDEYDTDPEHGKDQND